MLTITVLIMLPREKHLHTIEWTVSKICILINLLKKLQILNYQLKQLASVETVTSNVDNAVQGKVSDSAAELAYNSDAAFKKSCPLLLVVGLRLIMVILGA